MTNFKNYNILEDIDSGKFDSDSLKKEIQDSAITVSLQSISSDTTFITIYFNDELSEENITILDSIVQAHKGIRSTINEPKFDLFGNQLVANSGNAGIKETYISFNWCDKTTWYQNSIRITDEVLIDIGDHKTYQMSEPKIIIDVTHWKLSDENYKLDIINCKPIIKVNGSILNGSNPWREAYYRGVTLMEADYVIDYQTGSITFTNPLNLEDVVSMSYNKLPETDLSNPYGTRQSAWIMEAPTGYRVLLNRAEVQFSDDVRVNDSVRFVGYSTVGLDPALSFLMSAPYYYPSGTEVPLPVLNPELEKRFNTLDDFIDDADGYYGVPATESEGRTIRDLPVGKRVYQWTYQGNENMELNSALGRFMKIFLMDDCVFGGTRATASIYGTKFKL